MRLLTEVALFLSCVPFPLAGQSSQASFLQNHLKARQIITEAVTASGGAQAINALQQLEYKSNGSVFNATQSFDPEQEPLAARFAATLAFDYKNDMFYQLLDVGPPGIKIIPSPVFFKSGNVYGLNNFLRNYSSTKTDPGPTFDGLTRAMPPLVLKRLLKNIKSAEFVGEDSVKGQPVNVIEFSWDSTNRYRLDIDKADHRLHDVRLLAIDPLTGDDEFTLEYIGEQTVSGLRFPAQLVSYRHGKKFLEVTLSDIRVNQPLDASKFEIPAGFVETPSAPPPIEAKQIEGSLYEVSGLGGGVYRSQFVDLGDGIAVFEAPISFPTSQQIIGEIRKTLGEKPIKYVVLSHYHDDHSGGIGAYVALGATVITTKGNEDIVTRYARRGSVLAGVQAHPGLQPRFLDVTQGKLEINGEAGRKLIVYQVPDVPHVKDMLVLYDPATRTIMDGDLFASFFSPASPAYQRFAVWLQSPQAPEVARVAGVHHPPMTKKEFLDLTSHTQN